MATDTDLDELTAQTNAMVAEMDKPSAVPEEPNRELSDDVVRAVAESAKQLNDSTVEVLKRISATQTKLEVAPAQLRQGVVDGFEGSLAKFDERSSELDAELKNLEHERLALERRSGSIDKKGVQAIWAISGIFVLLSCAVLAGWFFWLEPKYLEYKKYRDGHQQIEESSLFGAHIRKSDEGGTFIVFDEGITIGPCSLPNCVGIKP